MCPQALRKDACGQRVDFLALLADRPALSLRLQPYHVGKDAIHGQELYRRALFCDFAFRQYDNLIRRLYRAHAVRNDQNGLSRKQP